MLNILKNILSLNNKQKLNRFVQVKHLKLPSNNNNVLIKYKRCHCSIMEATFIKSIESEKIKEYEKIDIFDLNEKKNFEILLLDDPEHFFEILNAESIQLIKCDNEGKNIVLVLNYLETILKYVLMYEGSFPVYLKYKEFVDNILNEVFLSSNKMGKYKSHIETFLNEKISKLDNQQNIFLLYFYKSLIKHCSPYNEIDFNEFVKNIGRENNFNSKINSNSLHDSLLNSVINCMNSSFVDLVHLTKRESYKTFIYQYKGEKQIPEIIVILSEIVLLVQAHIASKKINQNKFLNFFLTMDDAIADYLITKDSVAEINYFLLSWLGNLKNRFLMIAMMPFTFCNLCRVFIFRNGVQERKYFSSMTKFLREIYRDTFTTIAVNQLFRSTLHYIDNYLNNPEILKNFKILDLISTVYTLIVVKFDFNKHLYAELSNRIDEIFENEIFHISMVATCFSLLDQPEDRFFLKLFSDNRIYELDNKKFFNIGLYSAMAKFDDFASWNRWFANLQTRQYERFNYLDIKMLKDIKYLLCLINPKYKELVKIVDNFNFDKNELKHYTTPSKKWFHGQNLDKESVQELFIAEIFQDRNIKFKTQFVLEETLMDADFLVGDKIVIEICGPSHFMISGNMKYDKKTRIKKELWEYMGYYTIFLNYLFIPQDKNNLAQFMLNQIKDHVPESEYMKIFNK